MSHLRGWALPAAILLMLVAAGVASGPEDPRQEVAYSTYNPGPQGLYGIYGFLETEGQRPHRWGRPPAELPPEVERLVVWWPPDLTRDQWQQLEAWAGGAPGRTLIAAIPDPLWLLEERGQWREPAPAGWEEAGRPGSARPARLTPWTQGVTAVTGAAPEEPPANWGWEPSVRVYLADAAARPAAVGWDVGPGQVILFLRPDWLTNERLAEGDNLRLALGLLAGPPGTVAFSEYHLGLADPAESPASTPPAGAEPWRTVGYQALAAVLIYLLFRAARFGSPRPEPPVTPRESLEFVHALGNLYRQARARQAVTEALAELEKPGPTGERELVSLARRIEELQRRVEHGTGRRRGA